MQCALDTNRYSDLVDGLPDAVQLARTATRLIIPFIVLAEIRFGVLRGRQSIANEQKLRRFLNSPRVEVFYADDLTTMHWAQINQQLRTQGTPIPENDIWIASLCVQHNLPLYSRDAHFDHLPQLVRV